MRYASRAMALQLIDPANRHLERHQLLFAHPRSSIWLGDGHQNIAWLWQICARSVAPILKCTQSRVAKVIPMWSASHSARRPVLMLSAASCEVRSMLRRLLLAGAA